MHKELFFNQFGNLYIRYFVFLLNGRCTKSCFLNSLGISLFCFPSSWQVHKELPLKQLGNFNILFSLSADVTSDNTTSL